jgi:hypothetical protein
MLRIRALALSLADGSSCSGRDRVAWRSSLRHGITLAVALLATAPLRAQAFQQVVRMDSTIRCITCRIDLLLPIRLRGEHEFGTVPDRAFEVRAADDGAIYVAYEALPTEIHVHRRDGALVRKIGRSGAGPGEFKTAFDFYITGELLRVGDRRLRRITEIQRHTGSILRTVSGIPLPGPFIALEDGRFVLSGPVATRSSAGQPLHVYTRNGLWERSFGVSDPVLHQGVRDLLFRAIEPSGAQTFWAASRNEYRLEHWDVSGRLLRILIGERAWFAPWFSTKQLEVSRETPPPTVTAGIWLDQRGLLWVLIGRAAASWRDSFTGERDAMGHPARDRDKLYHTVLEVIDPIAGTVVARHLFPYVVKFAGTNTVWRSWIDADGLPRVELIPLRLMGR